MFLLFFPIIKENTPYNFLPKTNPDINGQRKPTLNYLNRH